MYLPPTYVYCAFIFNSQKGKELFGPISGHCTFPVRLKFNLRTSKEDLPTLCWGMVKPGLPDGIFSYQFGHIMKGFEIETVGIGYGHLKYFTETLCISWTFGNFVDIW
jgi:hypothetical protein